MSTLKEVLAQKIEAHRPRTVRLLKEHGDVKLSEVTIAQAIGGVLFGVLGLALAFRLVNAYEHGDGKSVFGHLGAKPVKP